MSGSSKTSAYVGSELMATIRASLMALQRFSFLVGPTCTDAAGAGCICGTYQGNNNNWFY